VPATSNLTFQNPTPPEPFDLEDDTPEPLHLDDDASSSSSFMEPLIDSMAQQHDVVDTLPQYNIVDTMPQHHNAVDTMSNSYLLIDHNQHNHYAAAAFDDSFLPPHLRNMPLLEPGLPGTATPRGIMDFNFNWDIDLTDMDMGILSQYNQQAASELENPSTDAAGALMQLATEQLGDGASVRHEAFKKSIWRYLPQRNRDFGAAEQPNLAFEDETGGNNDHQQTSLITHRAIHERLHRVTRDRLLAIVLSTCRPKNQCRIASAFPTAELLDGLVQYFLISPSLDAKSWFHLPTFSPTKLRPELMAGIIAAGAVSTPEIPLRKLGFALHEAARVSAAKAFEDDNTAIRDLEYLQTLVLSLEIGMWSGMSRKMEIAESFLQPLVTMLRRGGCFRRSTWKDIVPKIEEDGEALEQKWYSWIRQETRLRLVFRTLQLDRQSSMALLKPPLISYGELKLPLPYSDVLWQAESAQSWKSTYLTQFLTQTPRSSAENCLFDLSLFRSSELASFAYLYMIWGMVWDFLTHKRVTGEQPSLQTNSLLLSSRLQELTQFFDAFRVTSFTASNPSTILLVELMLMHLNTPLDDIQLFAGIEGQEEARRVYPVLQRWVKTASARQALRHAGLVLNAAKDLSDGLLCNFNAIAVYHAGLVIWGYSTVIRTLAPPGRERFAVGTIPILLDSDAGAGEIDIRRFITLDLGSPALLGREGSLILISDINAVMDSLIHLLRANHNTMDSACPPLVDNLVQLMDGLRCIST
jgi:hypothetical protein